MNLEDLTPELKEKALSCKTPEELLAFAKEQGYELDDDELESVSGGKWDNSPFVWDCDDYHYSCTNDRLYC